jgi:F-box interacting protein
MAQFIRFIKLLLIRVNINTGRPPVQAEIYVLAFDMVDEKFRKIPYPDFSSSSFVPELTLTEFGGCLVLIRDYFFCRKKYDVFECWILEDYKNHRWVKRTFHLPFGWMRYHHFLAFNNNTGEMLLASADVLRYTRNSKCLLYYNTNTGIFRRPELTEITPSWRRFSVDVTFDN